MSNLQTLLATLQRKTFWYMTLSKGACSRKSESPFYVNVDFLLFLPKEVPRLRSTTFLKSLPLEY